MVLSISRSRPRWFGQVEPQSAPAATTARPWSAERGATRWAATADVAGAFPGFAERGGLLANARVRLTERYLLVDEGRAHGFGLPVAALAAADVGQADGSRRGVLLRLAYHDGERSRTFAIRPHSPMLPLPRRGFERALATLRAVGLEVGRRSSVPSLALTWSAARPFQHENVIWSGRATAPVDDLSLVRAPCDLWLTTRSLMWMTGSGAGINRLPLDRIADVCPVQLDDRVGTPAVVVGHDDGAGTRHDLVFIFDRHAPAERNPRERGAFVVGLRSRGVPVGTAAPVSQPWRGDRRLAPVAANWPPVEVGHGSTPPAFAALESPESAPAAVAWTAADPAASDATHPTWPGRPGPASTSHGPDGGLVTGAEPATAAEAASVAAAAPPVTVTGVDQTSAVQSTDADSGTVTADRWRADTAGPDGTMVTMPMDEPPTPPPDRSTVPELVPPRSESAVGEPVLRQARTYEAAALATLAEVVGLMSGVRRTAGAPPRVWPVALGEALADVEAAEAAGLLAPESASARRARLLALSEAGARLRALLELRDAGLLSQSDLACKRVAVLAPLNRQLFGA